MINKPTHYDELGISRFAPPEVIRAAYKVLAQKYHPDKNIGTLKSDHKIKAINIAYEILSNPAKRAKYDSWLDQQEAKENKAKENKAKETNSHNKTTPQNKRPPKNTPPKPTREERKPTSPPIPPRASTINEEIPSSGFYGRLTRGKYILLALPTMMIWSIIYVLLSDITDIGLDNKEIIIYLVLGYYALIDFLVYLSIKRLHDINRNGWWSLVPLVTFILFFPKGTKGVNQYGLDPKKQNQHLNKFDGIFKKDYSEIIIIAVLCLGVIQAINVSNSIERRLNTYNKDQQISKPTRQSSIETKAPIAANAPSTDPVTNNVTFANDEKDYQLAVSNLNNVWNQLPVSIQRNLESEQYLTNKERQDYCKQQSLNVAENKREFFIYDCEVPFINKRLQELKSYQEDISKSVNMKNQSYGDNLNSLIHSESKKTIAFLNKDYADHDHELYNKQVIYSDVNQDGTDDAVVSLNYCEVTNCHMTTRSLELVVFIGVGNNQYVYGDAKDLSLVGNISVNNQGIIHTETDSYNDEDPHCCPSLTIKRNFKFENDSLIEIH